MLCRSREMGFAFDTDSSTEGVSEVQLISYFHKGFII